LLPLVLVSPALFDPPAEAAADKKKRAHRFFTAHQAAVVDAATRRIAPGPDDDPLEAGHPGAHEANVVHYIDTMLSMFQHRTPKLFAGGPWSNRHTHGKNHMATFVMPDRAQAQAWRRRIRQLRRTYHHGIAMLDRKAGGNFAKASRSKQDQILASAGAAEFTAVLFQHTIEGMYCVPEYGGNRHRVGWKEIGYPGDSMPRGYTAAEMAAPDLSVIEPTGIVAQLIDLFPTAAQAFASGDWRRA